MDQEISCEIVVADIVVSDSGNVPACVEKPPTLRRAHDRVISGLASVRQELRELAALTTRPSQLVEMRLMEENRLDTSHPSMRKTTITSTKYTADTKNQITRSRE